ncbi:MAG: RsmE family RNA methyltransferase [Bacilli bacterium]|nr:RsmE family RNA methyltransferase [Bacilli bacterium]
MQRYFGEVFEGHAILSEGDVFHLTRVMRAKIATEIEVVSDGRVFLGRVEKIKPLFVKIQKEIIEDNELKSDVVLIMAPLKGDKMDLVLQKATELGVFEIVIISTSRCIVHFKKDEVTHKLARFQKIIKEASEQSKRTHIPLISYLNYWNDLSTIRAHHKFIAYEEQSGPSTDFHKYIKQVKKHDRIAIVVGPEGGFTGEEVDRAKTLKYIPVSLGHRILRAETASIYALSVIGNLLEN